MVIQPFIRKGHYAHIILNITGDSGFLLYQITDTDILPRGYAGIAVGDPPLGIHISRHAQTDTDHLPPVRDMTESTVDHSSDLFQDILQFDLVGIDPVRCRPDIFIQDISHEIHNNAVHILYTGR